MELLEMFVSENTREEFARYLKRRVGQGAQRRATKTVWEARMSRYRRLKIGGGAFFYTLALASFDPLR
jgi:hypothetical protein